MSDRADEVAQEFVPENATKIMVETASGARRRYSAGEWRGQIVAALRAFAEKARREEREACAKLCEIAAMGVVTVANAARSIGKCEHAARLERHAKGHRDVAAAIRAREEGKG